MDELAKADRVATLDVLGMSALTGLVAPPGFLRCVTWRWWLLMGCACSDGVKDAIDWLYSRVQTARRM